MTAFSSLALRVGADRRHLVDAGGEPVLIHGDTAWSLITALTEHEIDSYLRDRHEKGFNAIIVNLIEHKFNGPATRAGETPFAQPTDWTTPNERYFAFADNVLRRAGELGIRVFLAPIYLGYAGSDEGWYEEVLANGVERCHAYGRFLGERYGGLEHIVWLMGGDRNPGPTLPHVDAVARGIKESGSRQLFSAHCAPERSAVEEYGTGGWLDLNTTYTYQLVHPRLRTDYRREPPMPFVLIESTYEGEHNASALQIRRQAYWAILSGAAGQFIGNRPIWLFDPGWREAMDGRASRDMVHLRDLFAPLPWHTLVPDWEHHVVTGGLGEFHGLDYVTAARAADGSLVVAYLPSRRPVTVDLSALAGGRAEVRWHNPRTGEETPIGTINAEGNCAFEPPDEGDWVLLLDGR
jgi:hypothetical protein